QRIGAQHFNGSVECQGICRDLLDLLTKMLCLFQQDLFGNGIWLQKSAYPQQVCCCRIALLDLFKGEGPCCRNWLRVIWYESSSFFEKICSVLAIEHEVI